MKGATKSPADKMQRNDQKNRLSEDLTVVLLRGNGSPRSFTFSIAALNRALTALGFTFLAALLASVIFAGLWLTDGLHLPRLSRPRPRADQAAPVPVAPAAPAAPTNFVEIPPGATPAPAVPAAPAPAAPKPEETKQGGIWQKLKGAVNTPPAGAPAVGNESELQKEVEGLRKDIAALGAKGEGRKDISPGNPGGLLQFFGPRSTLAGEGQSAMRVRNPRVSKESASRQIAVDFELHNVDPQQRQERGYIVVLAKSPDILVSYPNAVFAPSQNILLDFTKGETFAVSRFRQARATFAAPALEGKRVNYQILLFGTDGRVLANLPVEDSR